MSVPGTEKNVPSAFERISEILTEPSMNMAITVHRLVMSALNCNETPHAVAIGIAMTIGGAIIGSHMATGNTTITASEAIAVLLLTLVTATAWRLGSAIGKEAELTGPIRMTITRTLIAGIKGPLAKRVSIRADIERPFCKGTRRVTDIAAKPRLPLLSGSFGFNGRLL